MKASDRVLQVTTAHKAGSDEHCQTTFISNTKYKNLYFLKKKKSTKIYKKLIFLSFSRFLTGLLLLFCSLSMTCQASHCSLTQHFPSVSVQLARGKLLPIHTVSLLRIKIRDVIIISIF